MPNEVNSDEDPCPMCTAVLVVVCTAFVATYAGLLLWDALDRALAPGCVP